MDQRKTKVLIDRLKHKKGRFTIIFRSETLQLIVTGRAESEKTRREKQWLERFIKWRTLTYCRENTGGANIHLNPPEVDRGSVSRHLPALSPDSLPWRPIGFPFESRCKSP